MAKNAKNIKNIMAAMDDVKADDPDMIATLTEIAKRVAAAQGKIPASSKERTSNFNKVDPMEDLGCEGCQ